MAEWHEVDLNPEDNSGKRRTMNPKRVAKFRIFYGLLLGIAPISLLMGHYKWGALMACFAFLVVGFQASWKLKYLGSLHPLKYELIYGYCWLMGLYGGWFDFFTASVFFGLGLIAIGFSVSWTQWNAMRLILGLVNLVLSGLMFFFHLKFSLGYNL